jgi:S-adenosylmethionine-dependent methyltransferase
MRNHTHPSNESLLAEALTERFLACSEHDDRKRLASNQTDENLELFIKEHIETRLQKARSEVVPWMSQFGSLRRKNILELGCGTGASTVALAEQGATVTATDVDENALDVTRCRLSLHGLSADVLKHEGMPEGIYDIVFMYAVLEHMTLDERLSALRRGWSALPPRGLLVIGETPNRLWYRDDHTSGEPFFMWLPDDLAMLYARRTARPAFNEGVSDEVEFARWGRGVSFHDLEIALGLPASELPVVSALKPWMKKQRMASWSYGQARSSTYERFLKRVGPPVHRGFYDKWLDIILQKP